MIINRVSIVIGERRMTISETAKLAGIGYSTMDNIYRNNTKGIDFETLNRLCFALDCKPGELFDYIPD